MIHPLYFFLCNVWSSRVVKGTKKASSKDTLSTCRFLKICSYENPDDQSTVISNLGGCLLKSTSCFPYFLLLAFETGWIIKYAALLFLSPLAWLLYHLSFKEAAIKLLLFVALGRVKVSQIEMLSRSVLTKFFIEDIHPDTLRIFSSFGRRYIVTELPRVMVEPFAKEHLGATDVIGSELELTASGFATGFVKSPGIVIGNKKMTALKVAFAGNTIFMDAGIVNPKDCTPSPSMLKELHCVSSKRERKNPPGLFNTIVFHDGRLVQRPTPLVAFLILFWFPFGFFLAIIRMMVGIIVPMSLLHYAYAMLGVRVIVKGTPPPAVNNQLKKKTGVLFVCSHRSLLDPVFLSIALRRPITTVTYSISRFSEYLSPIPTVRFTRRKQEDANKITEILQEGDLAICPEGTTSRTPYLLRFSSLFAELTDQIVPVAMVNRTNMFHATSSGSWKAWDSIYFFMNPLPSYEITFLRQLPPHQTCSGGMSPHDVANNIQRLLAKELNFQCTNLTRKDKYLALAGTDGSFPVSGSALINKSNK